MSDKQFFHEDSVIRRQLVEWAGTTGPENTPKLEIVDAGGARGGDDYRKKILESLKTSNLLVLILTEPETSTFDWQLFEAGLFRGFDQEQQKRTVCFYPKGAKNLSPLADIHAIEAEPEKVTEFLEDLYTNKDFTNTTEPLNGALTKASFDEFFKGQEKSVSQAICDEINGVQSDPRPSEDGCVCHVLEMEINDSDIHENQDTELKEVDWDRVVFRSLSETKTVEELFGRAAAQTTKMSAIEAACDLGESDPDSYNTRWIEQLKKHTTRRINGDKYENLSTRIICKNQTVYLPQVSRYARYSNGVWKINVMFVQRIDDNWLSSAEAPIALAANINLANRIRHDFLKPKLRIVEFQPSHEAFRSIVEKVDEIRTEGFFVNYLTSKSLVNAFPDEDLQKMGELGREFEGISRMFDEALNDAINTSEGDGVGQASIDLMEKALNAWLANNASFLGMALNTVQQELATEVQAKSA
jgi:hypothetical protein